MEPEPGATRVEAHWVPADDARAAPLHDGLTEEYLARYGPSAYEEMSSRPHSEFAPPHGGFLVLTIDGVTVAGGGFRRHDTETAELKRIWTDPRNRRLGLARRTLAEIERAARQRGYRRLYLVTGPRQPEANRLYGSAGYRPVPCDPATTDGRQALCFEKRL
ncbi:GNAT family N-acetyltransferase [Streptomyces carminius]|uniref:GNAT family N-acetyltransferase n=1 Tax=Streptomyces carminius TaxID=2665496 RepID=A0A2M8M1V2_9ACTN|nr:GNAT family N-acetyltransferase [Streptomyces carminius]PJE98183.1 GNAT family N-acetyltransferase [Streptomyces carminius]